MHYTGKYLCRFPIILNTKIPRLFCETYPGHRRCVNYVFWKYSVGSRTPTPTHFCCHHVNINSFLSFCLLFHSRLFDITTTAAQLVWCTVFPVIANKILRLSLTSIPHVSTSVELYLLLAAPMAQTCYRERSYPWYGESLIPCSTGDTTTPDTAGHNTSTQPPPCSIVHYHNKQR